MPRGRHRHSPPLHRLLPPAAIAGVSLVCSLGPWVFTDSGVLRVLAAFAAAITVVGAAVLRRWDMEAGKQVADLTRARASDDWRNEERVAELETDLEESRELRVKLEQKLRAKRTELQGLRNEHAALLRRYATAETERASALEVRRLLELEAAVPAQGSGADADAGADADVDVDVDVDVKVAAATGLARALPAGAGESADTADTADEAGVVDSDAAALDAAAAGVSAALGAVGAQASDAGADADDEETPAAPAIFSPEGSSLFLRARAALARFDGEALVKAEPAPADAEISADVPVASEVSDGPGADKAEAAREDEAKGKSEAARGHTRAASTPAEAKPAKPARSTGHYTVPTAVAVLPAAAPMRRPGAEGGFDFFGTQKEPASAALEAVQNEDLADVVGQEALALHKAESEAQFKPADEESRGIGIGQVIDLTAHDETEQIDLQGLRRLRSAVS